MLPGFWDSTGGFCGRNSVAARRGWRLPTSIGRVYDASRIERVLGFRCATDFGSVLAALRSGSGLPFAHDPDYQSPKESLAGEALARGKFGIGKRFADP